MKKYLLDDSLGFAIARAHKALKTEVRRTLLESGLGVTVEQWGILSRLRESDGRSHKDLAESLFKDTPTITRMVDVMAGRGMVRRRRDAKDRRVYKVFLTDEGRRLRRELEPLMADVSERCFSFLRESERKRFKDMLDRLVEHLEKGKHHA
jgi:DNA-binding MarR family transcriptional regulator